MLVEVDFRINFPGGVAVMVFDAHDRAFACSRAPAAAASTTT
jgi:hypothetical protein